jgi:hypothetical protein
MPGINASVGIANGKQCYNVPADQVVVQQLLSRIPTGLGGADGKTNWTKPQGKVCAPDLCQAIVQFQRVNRGRLIYAVDGHVDPGGGVIQLMNRLASSGPGGVPGGHEGPADSGGPKRRLFIPRLVLQPPTYLRYPSGLTVSTRVIAGPLGLAPYRLWQRGVRILNYQRMLNILMDGGPIFPKWRDQNGNPWPRLNENGVLDPDTQEALRYYQTLWGLEPSGDLCMVTRTLLTPYLMLRGQLQLHYPTPRFRGRGAVGGGSVPSPSTSQGQLGFRQINSQITWNNSFGIPQNLWSGSVFMPDPDSTPLLLRNRTRWDFQPNPTPTFEVTLPAHAALGTGDVTMTCEMVGSDGLKRTEIGPAAVDDAPTAQCTFELKEPEQLVRPTLTGSAQDQMGQWDGSLKAGVKFKTTWKGFDLSAEGSTGVASHDHHVVIPLETKLEVNINF